ncbi:putative oxidoreductase, partial [Nymphaea thermarum]
LRFKKLLLDGADEQKDLKLVDAPVSGGVLRAATGTLTVCCYFTFVVPYLPTSIFWLIVDVFALTMSEKLYVIEGGAGAASSVKMVNQLLAGVHIAAAAEAMAFAARLGLRTRTLFDVIIHGGSSSWMFENRVPHMLDDDYTPYSAVDIFVKDLGIVLHESRRSNIPLHVSAVAHQQFLSGLVRYYLLVSLTCL